MRELSYTALLYAMPQNAKDIVRYVLHYVPWVLYACTYMCMHIDLCIEWNMNYVVFVHVHVYVPYIYLPYGHVHSFHQGSGTYFHEAAYDAFCVGTG